MGNNSLFFLIFILIIPVGIFLYMRNKKKRQQETVLTGNRKTRKDEVWNVVKTYLKENNEYGKEIVELFPAKRRDPNDTSCMSKEEKKAYKQKQKEFKQLKKTNPVEYKKIKQEKKNKDKKRQPENWLLYFQTWNSKTKTMDEPRILSVEIRYIRVDKKRTERKVLINGLANFDEEFKWIKPLKEKEDKIIEKQRRINEAKKKKVIEQRKKQKEKEEQKLKRKKEAKGK